MNKYSQKIIFGLISIVTSSMVMAINQDEQILIGLFEKPKSPIIENLATTPASQFDLGWLKLRNAIDGWEQTFDDREEPSAFAYFNKQNGLSYLIRLNSISGTVYNGKLNILKNPFYRDSINFVCDYYRQGFSGDILSFTPGSKSSLKSNQERSYARFGQYFLLPMYSTKDDRKKIGEELAKGSTITIRKYNDETLCTFKTYESFDSWLYKHYN